MRNHPELPQRIADDLNTQAEQASRADNLDSLRGHEGQAAALYFDQFAAMIKTDLAAEFDANGRQRRPDPDPINSALSFEVTHPVFGYKLSYRRMLTLHARMLAAWLLGEIPTLAFLTTR